ncbi:MAG TPA: class I SAM-dependent methyltransferase [Saprospiraceae bacterium]|nr:class I SAM-dependent methyltransferase [Saprospiraceae bacterium]
MNTQQLEIRDKQHASWNAFSPGWAKWDNFTMHFLATQAEQIISQLDLRIDDDVLDIATGTGEPGLTIASIANKGTVTAVDLSEGMLAIAREKAKTQGLNNFRAIEADACELPFEDGAFDAITCRLGFMFFPDMELAAREMLRVLKPGGKIVTTVWQGPVDNPWVTIAMRAIKKYLEVPAAAPGAPGIFRCAQPGILTDLFATLGGSEIQEIDLAGKMACSSVDEYWNFMNDVVPPVVSALKVADPAIRTKIRQEVQQLLGTDSVNQHIPFGARLISIRKPV